MPKPKLKGLIVDDSKLVQSVLTAIFESDDDLEVAGIANNGREAVEQAKALQPDFITMDIRMPVMDGLQAMELILADQSVPILVVSDVKDSQIAFKALSIGASEIVAKDDLKLEMAEALINKIKVLAQVKISRPVKDPEAQTEPEKGQEVKKSWDESGKVVVMAASTGGPRALSVILSALSADFPCPVLVAQHMTSGFVSGFVKWIGDSSSLKVTEGIEGEKVLSGTVYIAPTGSHMEIDSERKIKFIKRNSTDEYQPSCSKLLSSVASAFKENCIGVILTGAGEDGVEGIKNIKNSGGITLGQDEESSAFFGMSKKAIDSGYVDKVLPLQDIAPCLMELVCSRT